VVEVEVIAAVEVLRHTLSVLHVRGVALPARAGDQCAQTFGVEQGSRLDGFVGADVMERRADPVQLVIR
jgi:hypothetical protein